jgi:ATP-dependent exoDNAse (exonuclease V) beta subunit
LVIGNFSQMTKEFTPKGEDILRKEIVEEFGIDESDPDQEAVLNKILEREMKAETMKASLWKQKQEAKAKLEEATKQTPPKTDDKDEEKKEKQSMTDEEIDLRVDKKMFRANGGDDEQLRQIEKVMKATGKSFERAQKDSLYKAWNEDYLTKNERAQSSRDSQLPPSRGGTTVVKDKADEVTKKFTDNLPEEFRPVKK